MRQVTSCVRLAIACLVMAVSLEPAAAQESRFADPSVARSPQSLAASQGGTAATRDLERESTPEPQDADGPASSEGSRNFLSVLTDAGPMIFPLLGCSMLLVMFVFERAISLRRGRVIPKHFVKRFLHQLDEGELKPEEALDLCEENRSPIAEVFAAAVKKWNRPSVEIEQAVLDAGERVANGLRRYLRLFNGITTISPLLGLLGTVLGMIHCFNSIASTNSMGRPTALADGIGQALLTTAGGLCVAIPAFVAYMFFTSRVDRLLMDIDDLGQEVVGAIASDTWKARLKRPMKTTAKAA